MFRLPQFRRLSTKSFFTSAAIFVAIFSFVFSGFLRKGGTGVQQHIASQIGQHYVSMLEFQAALQRELQNKEELSPVEKQDLIQNIIQNLTKDKVLSYEGERFGFRASDQEVARWITKQETFLEDGKFSPSLYDKFLKNHTNEFELFRLGRHSVLQEKTVDLLTSLLAPVPLIEEAKKDLTSYEYRLSTLPVRLTESLMNQKIEKATKSWLQEREEELKAQYHEEIERFQEKAQVELDVIQLSQNPEEGALFSCEGAQDLMEPLKKNPNQWGTLAEAHSLHESKKQKGYLGWVSLEFFEEESQGVLRDQPLKEVGFFQEKESGTCWVFRKKAEKQAHQKSFEDVKMEMAKEKVIEQVKGNLKLEIQSDFERALKESKDLEDRKERLKDLEKKWSLSWLSEEDKFVSTEDYFLPGLGFNLELRHFLPALKKKGEILPRLIKGQGGSFVIRLEEIRSKTQEKSEQKQTDEFRLQQRHLNFIKEFKDLAYADYVDRKRIDFSPLILSGSF